MKPYSSYAIILIAVERFAIPSAWTNTSDSNAHEIVPRTLMPGDHARHPGRSIVCPVSTHTEIGYGKNAIVLWPILYGTQPMLMTYILDARLLHTAEMVQPLEPNGSILYPESLIKLENSIQYAQIPTDHLTMIGMHMSPTPWSKIGKTLRAAMAVLSSDAPVDSRGSK